MLTIEKKNKKWVLVASATNGRDLIPKKSFTVKNSVFICLKALAKLFNSKPFYIQDNSMDEPVVLKVTAKSVTKTSKKAK